MHSLSLLIKDLISRDKTYGLEALKEDLGIRAVSNENDRWLSMKEAVTYTNKSAWSLIKAYHEGKLKGSHSDRRHAFKRSELDNYMYSLQEPQETRKKKVELTTT